MKDKRQVIQKMKLKCKELALNEALMICAKCQLDISPLRTIDYIKDDMHHAKCIFGTLKRISIEEAQDPMYIEDQDFVEMYKDQFQSERA